MNEVTMLYGNRPRRILKSVMEEHIPAMVRYLREGQWYESRVLLTEVGEDKFQAAVTPFKKNEATVIEKGQAVGVSVAYNLIKAHEKIVFDTKVLDVANEKGQRIIVMEMPEEIDLLQEKGYGRAAVPGCLDIDVTMWISDKGGEREEGDSDSQKRYRRGKLVDISADGLQVAMKGGQGSGFGKGDSVGLRFVPLPYESPMVFNAEVRNVQPLGEGEDVWIGLEIVGLEGSAEGRMVLQRLAGIVEQYKRMKVQVGRI